MATDTHSEPHAASYTSQLNWLRAAVLGANDGIVSLAALLVGVAGATSDVKHIFITGVAGLLAGAFSMAVGEYVSVSSQRDTEEALLAKETYELEHYPEAELEELIGLYQKKGLSRTTAEQAARELTAHNALEAHLETELRMHPEEFANPVVAAFASGASFTVGALIPLVTIMLPPEPARVPATFAAVFVALVVTGVLSARMSDASVFKVVSRVVGGGVVAMVITFGIGLLFGVSGAL